MLPFKSGKRAQKKNTDMKEVNVLNDTIIDKMQDQMGAINMNFRLAYWPYT